MATGRPRRLSPAGEAVLYWDSSAVLSALFRDGRSDEARAWVRRPGAHLLSTLAWAEVHAVIARMKRERVLSRALAASALEALDWGPWRRTNISPGWRAARGLAARRSLRGSDLWHLAAAASLKEELAELRIVSFDERLARAARAEGLA